MVLRADELQLSRGESLRDTALVLSRHVCAVGVRTGPDAMLAELAEYSSVPIFNMLTALHHPCQALADLLTLREALGTFEGARIAYVGDGNNVARSLALLGTLAGLDVAVASPPGYALEEDLALLDGATGSLELHTDPLEAVAGAQASTPTCGSAWATRRPPTSAARRSRATGSTTRCSTPPRPAPSRCTTCPRIPARRSPRRSSTAHASASGIRPRTAAMRRRLCLELLVAPADGPPPA